MFHSRPFAWDLCSRLVCLGSFIWGRSLWILVCSLSCGISRLGFVVWFLAFGPPIIFFIATQVQEQISWTRTKRKKCRAKSRFLSGTVFYLTASEPSQADISSILRFQGGLAQPFRAIWGYGAGSSSNFAPSAAPGQARAANSSAPAKPSGLEVGI